MLVGGGGDARWRVLAKQRDREKAYQEADGLIGNTLSSLIGARE